MLLVCLATAASALGADVEVREDSVLAAAIATEINAARSQNGLSSLRTSNALNGTARRHARSMATFGYFSHSSIRSLAAAYVKGKKRWAVGEIMVWAPGHLSAAEAVDRWLASPPHRSDMLGRWRHIGVGALDVQDAPGVFGGKDITLVVVNFGRRS